VTGSDSDRRNASAMNRVGARRHHQAQVPVRIGLPAKAAQAQPQDPLRRVVDAAQNGDRWSFCRPSGVTLGAQVVRARLVFVEPAPLAVAGRAQKFPAQLELSEFKGFPQTALSDGAQRAKGQLEVFAATRVNGGQTIEQTPHVLLGGHRRPLLQTVQISGPAPFRRAAFDLSFGKVRPTSCASPRRGAIRRCGNKVKAE
jgi:hypothetical protein